MKSNWFVENLISVQCILDAWLYWLWMGFPGFSRNNKDKLWAGKTITLNNFLMGYVSRIHGDKKNGRTPLLNMRPLLWLGLLVNILLSRHLHDHHRFTPLGACGNGERTEVGVPKRIPVFEDSRSVILRAEMSIFFFWCSLIPFTSFYAGCCAKYCG